MRVTHHVSRIMPDLIGTTVAAILTLFVYSYLLRDTLLYRIAEHLLVGIGVAYAVVVAVHNVLIPDLLIPLRDAPSERADLLIPFSLGILLLAKAVPRGTRLGNPSVAYITGVGLGLAVGGALVGTLFPQLQATMLPIAPGGLITPNQVVLNLIIVVGTLITLFSFSYTRPATSAVQGTTNIAASDRPTVVQRVGRWFIMIAFGAILGGTILTYATVLAGRMDFLINDWLRPFIGF